MTDDAYNPTLDLCWGVPAQLYYEPIFDSITYTNNNLFNKYWYDFILEIIHPSSKIVRAKFNLRPYDILKLDFRKIYYFDNAYFRLNRVIDYNPIANDLTECEFIKIYKGISFTAQASTIDGSLTTMGVGDSSIFNSLLTTRSREYTPIYNAPVTRNNNTIRGMDSTGDVKGYGNRIGVGVRSYYIVGNYNNIGDNCSSVVMLDSSGCTVAGGISNVKLIGCNNLEVLEGNTTVINNVVMTGDNSTNTTTQNSAMTDRGNNYFIDTTASNKTFRLLTAQGREGRRITVKNIGVNTLRIIANDGETIDGSNFYDITSVNDCRELISNGDNWYVI
jgi:hypothetical protein